MSTVYLFFKSFHIVGFVAWFAGLFYLVRMFVYFAEAEEQPVEMRTQWKNQLILMQERVYKIIATPAMFITLFFGIGMLVMNPAWLYQPWMLLKLVLLVLMVVYHFLCKRIITQNQADKNSFTPFQFRLINELPTLFLVSIVLLAVLKNIANFVYLFTGVIAFGVILFLSARAYKNHRLKKLKNQ
jgi:putative membrane protein